MWKSSAFCPAYATGIFTIEENDAAGAGFCIDKGMVTEVLGKNGADKPSILMNGKRGNFPVSLAVLEKYCKLGYGAGGLEIRHYSEIPIGFGLGMSAAGALSLSLALNEFFGAGLGFEKCVKIAHDCEVECKTGLSGADAAAIGGILARIDTKSPPFRIKAEPREIEFAFFRKIETGSIIGSKGWKEKVNRAGRKALQGLGKERTWDCFIESSRAFARESGLAFWCAEEMEKNRRASMAMVGRTLFSDASLSLSRKPYMAIKAKTSERGAGILR